LETFSFLKTIQVTFHKPAWCPNIIQLWKVPWFDHIQTTTTPPKNSTSYSTHEFCRCKVSKTTRPNHCLCGTVYVEHKHRQMNIRLNKKIICKPCQPLQKHINQHFINSCHSLIASHTPPTNDIVSFSLERLISITTNDIVCYFNTMAYGTLYPTEDDPGPPLCFSSTLFYQKKTILYFVSHQNMLWDDLAHQGNPTKSTSVNKVIKGVKNMKFAIVDS
jgi:hypothetical protein